MSSLAYYLALSLLCFYCKASLTRCLISRSLSWKEIASVSLTLEHLISFPLLSFRRDSPRHAGNSAKDESSQKGSQ